MNPIITAELTEEARRTMEFAQRWPDLAVRTLITAMDAQLELILGKIIQERFTGQGPFPVADGRLGNRTSRLKKSLDRTPAQAEGTTINASLGSNVEYFAVHEFGFEGDVSVKSFTRKVSPSQFTKAGGGYSGRLKNRKALREHLGTETVKAHSRHMRIPARAPLGHGLADHLPEMGNALATALQAAWEEGRA